jgi:DNA-binding response OmpR family regulator
VAEKILIVDDNQSMRRSLARLLETEAYQVAEAADGEEGLVEYARFLPDLVVMDINMPRMNGLEAIRQLRQFSGVPILVLSVRGSETDKVAGLDTGADDYLPKPFGAEEFLARLRALLRRQRLREIPKERPGVLRLGGGELIIDPAEQRVLCSGQVVHLTPLEAKLLFTLAQRPGEPFSQKQLLAVLWRGDPAATMSNLKLYILYLRRKLEPDPTHPRYVLTVRGSGYKLAGV